MTQSGGPAVLACHICGANLSVRLAEGRKSGKRFIMLHCPVDGRHIRAFVADKGYVTKVLDRLEAGS